MTARPTWPAATAFPLAVIVAATSIGGILLPSTYARETASWRAQGIEQDWFDLLVLVPAMIAAMRRRGLAAEVSPVPVLRAIALASCAVLALLLRRLRRDVPAARPASPASRTS